MPVASQHGYVYSGSQAAPYQHNHKRLIQKQKVAPLRAKSKQGSRMTAAWGNSAANMALVSKQANQNIDSKTVLQGKKMSQKIEDENNYQSAPQQLDIKLRGQNPHKLNSS